VSAGAIMVGYAAPRAHSVWEAARVAINSSAANSAPTISSAANSAATRRGVDGAWPNEPDGFTPIVDQPWNAIVPSEWTLMWGTARIVRDTSAPFSPPRVLQIEYPIGMEGGIAPGTLEHRLDDVRGLFVGMWWRVNAEWQGHPSNVNKLQFVFAGDGGDITMVMYGVPGGPFELRVLPQFLTEPSAWLTPNRASVHFRLGAWHRVEWFLQYPTPPTEPYGTVRWWLDGELLGEYTTVRFPAQAFVAYKISPTWGGIGGTKTQRGDRYELDHVYMSVLRDTSR
jgi:hypothetical protein